MKIGLLFVASVDAAFGWAVADAGAQEHAGEAAPPSVIATARYAPDSGAAPARARPVDGLSGWSLSLAGGQYAVGTIYWPPGFPVEPGAFARMASLRWQWERTASTLN